MDSTVSLDVNNVADLVGLQVGGKLDGHTMLPEVTGEHVAGASTDTIGVRHDESILLREIDWNKKRKSGISPPWSM